MLGLARWVDATVDKLAKRQADRQEREYWARINDGFDEDRRLRAEDVDT